MSIDTQKPMVSPETQQLMDLCAVVAKGAEDRLPELKARLQERQVVLSQAWEGFGRLIEQEGPAFVEPRKPIVEAVEAQYQAYAHALEKVGAFVDQRSDENLKAALESLQTASPMLLAAIMSFEMSILTAGPSKFPTVNMFENMGKRLRAGELGVQNWRNTSKGHAQLYQQAADELDKPAAASEPGVPERKAALTTLVGIFKRLEGMGKETPPAEFEAAVALMAQAHLELEAAINTWTFHTFSEKPTASPQVNRVLYTLNAVREGKQHVDVLNGLIGSAQEQIRQSIKNLTSASRLPAESEVVAEELPKILEALESMDEGLEGLKNAADPWTGIDDTVAALEAAVARLSAGNEVITKHNEAYGKVTCPHCSAPNPSTSKTCEKCHRQLPQFAGSEVYGAWSATNFQVAEGGAAGPRDFVMTKNMKALGDACEAYEKGTLPQEDFLAHLKEHEERVRRAEILLGNTKLPDVEKATEEEREKEGEFVSLAADAVGLLAQGVGQCQSGLMKLERYALQDDANDMREGLKEFFDGCQKLLQINLVAKAFLDAIPPLPEKKAAEGEAADDDNPAPSIPVDGLAPDASTSEV